MRTRALCPWDPGVLGRWGPRGPGILGFWDPRVLESSDLGVLGSWVPGILGPWGPGILGSWKPGALGSWEPGPVGSWDPVILRRPCSLPGSPLRPQPRKRPYRASGRGRGGSGPWRKDRSAPGQGVLAGVHHRRGPRPSSAESDTCFGVRPSENATNEIPTNRQGEWETDWPVSFPFYLVGLFKSSFGRRRSARPIVSCVWSRHFRPRPLPSSFGGVGVRGVSHPTPRVPFTPAEGSPRPKRE